MYYNRNLITASEQAVTRTDASGVFDLQTQAVSQNEKDWPGSETASIYLRCYARPRLFNDYNSVFRNCKSYD